jgi:glyoxylase-like metal-dependent hydrolase (beta-lactamase superfamily II)
MVPIARVLAPNPGVRELEGTNTWVVGARPAIVIDPGPDDGGHLREIVRTAREVGAIVLTHDHPDHAPGAASLAAMTDASVFAMRGTGAEERLHEEQVVSAGTTALRTIATPGHTPDHVSFLLESEGALFTGDTVLGHGTSVIDPPEGDLAQYLRSLKRLRDLEPRTIYPGHGPVVLRAVAKIDEYLAHRHDREEQVLAALRDGASTPEEMVPAIYAGYPPEVYELAARSLLAHLMKLEAEGRAERRAKSGEVRWSVLEPRSCARCGRPVRGRARYCGSCSLILLQGSD